MITSQLYYHCTKQAFMEIPVGIEPTIKELQFYTLSLGYGTILAGIAGVEPAHQGVKVPCLTTWLLPYFWWAEKDSDLRTQ